VVFLAVLAGGYLLGRRVDRRLKALRAAAEALGGGNLAGRIPVDSHDELSALARVLNTMAENLAAKLAELQAERDTRDAVLANLPQGIALLTSDLTILHANDQFWMLLGVQRPSTGSPRLAAARQPALEEIAHDALRAGASVRRELTLYVEEKRENEISIVPVTRSGVPQAWLLTIEDLRPERAAANLRREFVANVSHELKTPLTSIRGYAETLLEGGLEDEEHRRRFVETIRGQAVRLEALVEDLLQLADLDRPDSQLTLRDWDIFCHGTYDERTELHAKRDAEAKARMQEEFRMERLLEEREESREQKEMEEWREQHQAARDAERKKASADRFMMECIKIAEQVADAPDERARALQMAALAAKAVARLATNELIDNDTQQQAALLAGRLIDSLQLEVP
jgi:two-component system phosphate regulon sensor histidine kinase PhoR